MTPKVKVAAQEEGTGLCPHLFNVDKFNANITGGRERVKQTMELQRDEEVNNIFNSYCPQGTMNVVTWVTFCKDLNLFSEKRKFLLPEAHLIFQNAFSSNKRHTSAVLPKIAPQCTSGITLSLLTKLDQRNEFSDCGRSVVHFTAFRFVMLLAVAVRKRSSIDVLLNKILTGYAPNRLKSVPEARHESTEKFGKQNSRPEEWNFHHQTEYYQRQARLTLKKLTETTTPPTMIKNYHTPLQQTICHQKRLEKDKRTGSISSEDKLCAIFMSHTGGSHVMSLDQFVQMCQACNLIQGSNFHLRDARQVFKNAILLAASPTAGKMLNAGIVDKQFITYSIFRGFAVPYVARKKKKKCTDVIELFL